MKHAAEQSGDPGGLHHRWMGVSPLDDGYRGFADRENVTGLNQIPCVVAQHIDCVVEGAQQMRFQRKHLAVLTKPVVSLGGLQNGRPA